MALDLTRFVHIDKLGIDPLKNKLYQNLDQITQYTDHTVTDSEESNPQLIAFDYYDDVELFGLILAFNGIANGMDIKAGDTLRIPDSSQVLAFSKSLNRNRTVSI